jgi:hypothetical protein
MNLPFLVGLAFVAFGAWMLVHAVRSHRRARLSQQWPTAEGTLEEVFLWGRRNVDGEMKDVERLSVSYRYTVDGKALEGRNVTFYTLVYPETVAFAEAHPEGSMVPVYYNPDQPSESVLRPGPRAGHKRFSDIILALLGILVGAGVAAGGWFGFLQ